jgi:hypothetical protein
MIKSAIARSVFFLLLILITNACTKTTYSIKIVSYYLHPVSAKIGPADYGTVVYGYTTDYKEVSEGGNTVTITDNVNQSKLITSTITSGGKGKNNKYTLTIKADGKLDFATDK